MKMRKIEVESRLLYVFFRLKIFVDFISFYKKGLVEGL